MDDALFDRMLRGIVGFRIEVGAVRETVKLSQHRPADLAGTLAGLRAAGQDALADAMAGAA
jgi:transcriptional regulator